MLRKMQVVCGIVGGLLLAGCNAKVQGQGGAVSYSNTSTGAKVQASPSASAMKLASGFAPRNYVVATGGYLFVKDTTADKMIYDAAVPANTIVKIDQGVGVTVGSKVVVGGPLPAGHHYEMWLDRNPKLQ